MSFLSCFDIFSPFVIFSCNFFPHNRFYYINKADFIIISAHTKHEVNVRRKACGARLKIHQLYRSFLILFVPSPKHLCHNLSEIGSDANNFPFKWLMDFEDEMRKVKFLTSFRLLKDNRRFLLTHFLSTLTHRLSLNYAELLNFSSLERRCLL